MGCTILASFLRGLSEPPCMSGTWGGSRLRLVAPTVMRGVLCSLALSPTAVASDAVHTEHQPLGMADPSNRGGGRGPPCAGLGAIFFCLPV